MARKEINVFNVSFLDLLSGALGAVIILYIIVPKLAIPVEQFEEQQQIAAQIENMGVSIDKIKDLIPKEVLEELEVSLQTLKAANDSLTIKVKNQAEKLAECESEKVNLQEQVESMEKEIESLKQQLADCEAELAKCPPPCPPCPQEDITGFVLSRNVLFVIDVSGSMADDNKLNEVKAGIKMMIATMNDGYFVDIMFYPNEADGTAYGHKFGNLQPVSENRKYEFYNFIASLSPNGYTPTEDALSTAIKNYQRVETIVLLSDGAPSDLQGNASPTNSIISNITALNAGRVKINTIGVGKEFRQTATSDTKEFLRALAERNGGFYVGF